MQRRSLLAALPAALLPAMAQAQAGFPDHAVTITVPFSAGGPTDVIARLVAEGMSRDLG